MYTLKMDRFTIPVTDYCPINSMLALDIEFQNKNSVQDFLSYYQDLYINNSTIDFELDGISYHGCFGVFLFDSQHKARLYIIIEPDQYKRTHRDFKPFNQNVITILNNHKTALKKITEVLQRNNLLDDSELSLISKYLPNNNYGIELYQKVPNLDEYLKAIEDTLDDIRNP